MKINFICGEKIAAHFRLLGQTNDLCKSADSYLVSLTIRIALQNVVCDSIGELLYIEDRNIGIPAVPFDPPNCSRVHVMIHRVREDLWNANRIKQKT